MYHVCATRTQRVYSSDRERNPPKKKTIITTITLTSSLYYLPSLTTAITTAKIPTKSFETTKQ